MSDRGEVDIDDLLQRLQQHSDGREVPMSYQELVSLCRKAISTFMDQPMLLELKAPINVVGDLHGQFADLLRLLAYGGQPPFSHYLFTGDYVDRGKRSLETIALLLCFRIKYPDKFFLLRGNHENEQITKVYGFYDEVMRRFSIKLFREFCQMFDWMPLAARINCKIFCVHGGLSPHLHRLTQIDEIERPTEVPSYGLMCDLLWSDPVEDVNGWSENGSRNISYQFGPDLVKKFCEKHHLDLVVRAHQVPVGGYSFFANNQLLTIFSAPNYMGTHMNDAAFLEINRDLVLRIRIIRPTAEAKENQVTPLREKTLKVCEE